MNVCIQHAISLILCAFWIAIYGIQLQVLFIAIMLGLKNQQICQINLNRFVLILMNFVHTCINTLCFCLKIGHWNYNSEHCFPNVTQPKKATRCYHIVSRTWLCVYNATVSFSTCITRHEYCYFLSNVTLKKGYIR